MSRLDDTSALDMYLHASLHDLGATAHAACLQKHPEDWRTYVIDRNVNYTNVCRTRCKFCAFSVDDGDARGYVLARENLLAKVQELVDAGGTQVLLQGGMHPRLGLDFYTGMLRDLRAAFPSVQLHAFSPPEIWFFHEQFGLPVDEVLARLVEAGLSSIPGGGAEVLVDRVRHQVSPTKCTADQWLDVMHRAHAMGLMTTATMMFGHADTPADRIEHLRRLRDLQDESLALGRGHFTAFICWTFQSLNTQLASQNPPCQPICGSVPYLRMLATARLYLDNFANLQASWVTQGPKIGQMALFYGANDMGGLMM